MRALVVDDDEASRYLLASLLGSAGHETEMAIDGVEALAKARTTRPDIIISDILMPRMDGYQLAREWKADAKLAPVPIIFCTASYTEPADEQFALDLGVDGFLNKPIDPDVLFQTIARVTNSNIHLAPREPRLDDEVHVLREYNERLVHKLEQKVVDLERTNAKVEATMRALSEEMEVKKDLVANLRMEVEERRRREEELRRERDFTSRIVDTADVFIVGLDRDLRIVLFSTGASRMSGYAAEDVAGKHFLEMFVPEEDHVFTNQYVRAVQQGPDTVGRTGALRMSSGEVRTFEWSATPSSGAGESAEGILLFGVDVTERVTAAAVDRAMARIDLAVLLDRPRAEILDVACERLVSEFGFGMAFIALTDSESKAGLEMHSVSGPLISLLAESTEHGSPVDVCPVRVAIEQDSITILSAGELAKSSPFGMGDAVEMAAIPLRAHGITMGAIGLVSVVPHAFTAHRREVLRRLADRVAVGLLVVEGREQVALQSAALESAGNAIVIVTATGRVSWVNRAFGELTGYSAFEATGAELFEGGAGYREPLYTDAWGAVIEGNTWRGEIANTRKDGTAYSEDVTLAPVRDEYGEVQHVVIIKQDVSERRELEQIKSDFVAVVSHELRTPLTSIIGYADLIASALAKSGDAPPTVETALSKLQTNAGRMRALVEQLLEVVQVRADLLALDLCECDVGALVTRVARDVVRTSAHELHVDVGSGIAAVSCDQQRLARALELLLDNAVKYSPDGGEIRVDVRHVGHAVTVSIADEGVGMPADRIPGLFDDFTQLDMTSTRRFGGMGLGLFLAYNIVRAHGGNIIATSEEGKGSTFIVQLPVRDRTR